MEIGKDSLMDLELNPPLVSLYTMNYVSVMVEFGPP